MLKKTMPPRFKFEDPSNGWMIISVDDFSFDVSDVPCDSIYGLCKALSSILSGSCVASVDWSLEPNYLTWKFTGNSSNCIFSLIDDEGSELSSWSVQTQRLVRSILNALRSTKASFDKDNELLNWSWEYPSDAIRVLEDKFA